MLDPKSQMKGYLIMFVWWWRGGMIVGRYSYSGLDVEV
jgi:hypothetical protein